MSSVSEEVDLLVGRLGERPLQILVEIQKTFNHVPTEAVEGIARKLGLPVSRVLANIEFYSFLSLEKPGDYVLLMSDNITDWMAGSRSLYSRLCSNLEGIADATKTSCTGMCDQGPAMLVNGIAVTKLDENRIDSIADLVKRHVPLSSWPREYFHVESNIRKSGWLFESGRRKVLEGQALLQELKDSNLRGRGGAGFPTALKWASCREATGEKYVVCNADEGEPGTFKDRVLLTHCAENLLEGMALCANIVGAKRGFLYVRGEYRYLESHLAKMLRKKRSEDFTVELHWGAGAYICGEESALLESIEGKRGIPRVRPPFPVTHGLFGMPTVVDNVETFCAASGIAAGGGKDFRRFGTDESRGTKLLSVSGDCSKPGIYEYPFGVSIEQILADCGADEPIAVQVGGASGACLDASEFGRKIGFEDLPTSGSVMIFGKNRDMKEAALNFSKFFAHESCGFCTPCRVGTSIIEQILESGNGLAEMPDLAGILKASHCGLGQSASRAVMDMLKKFPGHWGLS